MAGLAGYFTRFGSRRRVGLVETLGAVDWCGRFTAGFGRNGIGRNTASQALGGCLLDYYHASTAYPLA